MPATCSNCHPPPLLDVQHLHVAFDSAHGVVHAVNGANWQLQAGECLAIVGESGSGKSISALSIMGLLPKTAHINGRVLLDGRDILQLPEAQRRQLRGKDIGMVFQDPLSALNPVHRVGEQIAEAIRSHQRVSQKAALAQAVELLHEVGIPNPPERARDYPHQFSGGMRQRVVIAMALANNPRILIADEPTTALDVTVQAQIMELLARLREKRQTALVLITHDLGLVASQADRVLVMYAGRVVETAAVETLFSAPLHPYTHGLLDSLTRIDAPRQQRLHPIAGQPPSLTHLPAGCAFAPRCENASATCARTAPTLSTDGAGHAIACHHPSRYCSAHILHPGKARNCDCHLPYIYTPPAADADGEPPVLEVAHLCKTFHGGRPLWPWKKAHAVHAVRDVCLQVRAGETLGIVGESGCGKSSLSRCILRLHEPSSGAVRFCGQDLLRMNPEQLRNARQHLQMVFQDPHGCLDPRYTVRELLSEPFLIHGLPVSAARIDELLRRVGLAPEHASRRPHEFSGGQLQRIGIARAIALNPKLVICDEPVSALDVSIRAQIINLLCDLQAESGMSYLFIAHDLSVVRHIAHRVAVMYRGQIVETAEVEELFANPLHPYTQALLAAVPVPDPAVERSRKRQRTGGNGTAHAADVAAAATAANPVCEGMNGCDDAPSASELLPIHPGSSHWVRRAVAA